MRINVNVEYDH